MSIPETPQPTEPSPSPLARATRFITGIAAREITGWPKWWAALPTWRKILPAAFILVYWAALSALGGFRSDHVMVGIVTIVLAYGGRLLQTLFRFMLPVILTGVVYDSQRFYSDYIRGEIRVAFPYEFDKRWFGIETATGRLTPNEWFQLHTHWLLDLVSGFFYLFFIAIYVMISAYHAFVLPVFAGDPVQRRRAQKIGGYVTWAFFWLNVIGYSTYYWFPAAPPWYVADHGLGPARLDTLPSPAGAIRFDQLLGTHFFTGMYGRSADVFGAIPSLHVSYPLLSIFFAFYLRSLRTFSVCFYLVMCFSAVYLNHHYVIDILWGSTYALIVFLFVRAYAEKKWRKNALQNAV
jgi:membrane-associated phospholipid phosphatase